MSAKFTPGPWLVSLSCDEFGMHEIESEALPKRNAEGDRGRVFVGYCKPQDATLIAAAPELFEAVDILVKSFTAAGIAADCDSNDPAEVLMCKAMRAWLKAGAV